LNLLLQVQQDFQNLFIAGDVEFEFTINDQEPLVIPFILCPLRSGQLSPPLVQISSLDGFPKGELSCFYQNKFQVQVLPKEEQFIRHFKESFIEI
jgi:hypothetical protein